MTRSLLLRLLLAAVGAGVTGQPLGAAVTLHIGPAVEGGEVRQGGQEHTETVSERFPVGASGALDLSNIAGDVRITGDGGTEVRVEAVKRVRHADAAEARRLLAALRVEMTHVRGRVEVRTEYPRNERRFSGGVSYTVNVPTGTAVTVKTISGDVVLASVSGDARIESVSGDVDVSQCPGLAHARTVSGDVRVQDVGSQSMLTLGSVSGNVVARAVTAPTLDAGTVSGDLRLSGIEADRIQAKSVSGTIEFGDRLARGGRYEFTSHSGDVRLTLSGDTGFEISADTFSGSIRSDYPVTLRTGDDDGRRGRGRTGGTRTIRGTFGDASAVIAARSFSGSIVLTRR